MCFISYITLLVSFLFLFYIFFCIPISQTDLRSINVVVVVAKMLIFES